MLMKPGATARPATSSSRRGRVGLYEIRLPGRHRRRRLGRLFAGDHVDQGLHQPGEVGRRHAPDHQQHGGHDDDENLLLAARLRWTAFLFAAFLLGLFRLGLFFFVFFFLAFVGHGFARRTAPGRTV